MATNLNFMTAAQLATALNALPSPSTTVVCFPGNGGDVYYAVGSITQNQRRFAGGQFQDWDQDPAMSFPDSIPCADLVP